MGLDIWIKLGEQSFEAPSTNYPDHGCNLGYFRSSYNGSGFNNIISNMLNVPGFYHLFNTGDPDEDFQPNWAEVRERCMDLLMKFNTRVTADGGLIRTFHVGVNPYENLTTFLERCPKSGADAIALLRRELAEKKNGSFKSYTNRDGDFHLDGLTIVAAVPGASEIGSLGVWLVYRSTADYYRQTIEILMEACERILAMPPAEQKKIRVIWSG